MFSIKTLLICPDWNIPFKFHTDASYKQLGDVISQNNKPIELFLIRIGKPQCNYTITKKEILAIVEFLKQFQVILFGYEIKLFSDHKILVYVATLSESQQVVHWQLILEEFGLNI